MAYARGYIINDSNNTLNIYMNAATHELGHALGWMGHSTDKNDVICIHMAYTSFLIMINATCPKYIEFRS